MNEIQNLLEAYQDIISKGETDVVFNNTVKHRIDFKYETHLKKKKPRRIPPSMFEEISIHL